VRHGHRECCQPLHRLHAGLLLLLLHLLLLLRPQHLMLPQQLVLLVAWRVCAWCVRGVCMWQQRAMYRGRKDTRSTERARWEHEDDRVRVRRSSVCVRQQHATNTEAYRTRAAQNTEYTIQTDRQSIQDARSTEYRIQNTHRHTRQTEHVGHAQCERHRTGGRKREDNRAGSERR
jgi:hypothetical protein